VKPTRDVSIDRFRGALVMMMVTGNFLSGIEFVPDFLKHAPDIGFTVADAVAPAFVFVIGLNLRQSLERRLDLGTSKAYWQLINRYLALIGIGAVIAAGANMVGTPTDWGVLQAIGVAGLISLPFLRFSTWQRFVVGLVILIGYQYLLDVFMLETVLNSVHGGLFGAVSWAALLILSTVFADLWRLGVIRYFASVVAISLLAAGASVVVDVSKHRVSLSYVLISLAISAAAYWIFRLLSQGVSQKPGLFAWWGGRALALYLLHLLVLTIFVTPEIDWWYTQASIWLAIVEWLAILAILSLAAWRFAKGR
jgi:hypothetical protein